MGVAEREDVLDTEQQTEETTEEQVEQTGTEGGDTEESGEGEDEDVVQIGDEEPPASEEETAAPKWVKDLRDRQKLLVRENAELKAQLQTGQPAVRQAPKLPEKPKLVDYDYDEEKFQAATDGWYATKREVEAHEASQQEAVKAQQQRVQAVHENYATSVKALKVKNFQDAEDAVKASFDEVQQSITIAGASNPGAVVFALGMNPKKLAELASIKDPVKFAVAVGKLETEVKVTKRTSTKPAPETTVRSTGSAPASTATLDRLEAEAAKTGDRSKVIAYKRQLKQSGK